MSSLWLILVATSGITSRGRVFTVSAAPMTARDHLFDDDSTPSPEDAGPRKPFAQYLRETPPAPLSTATKLALWSVGVLTVLLFLASLLKMAT